MSSNLLGQQSTEIEAYHVVILKSRSFNETELADLQTRLSNDGPFTIHETCRELGLMVIRIPVAASLRVYTIEEIIVAATHEILNHDASVIQNKTPLDVANCSN